MLATILTQLTDVLSTEIAAMTFLLKKYSVKLTIKQILFELIFCNLNLFAFMGECGDPSISVPNATIPGHALGSWLTRAFLNVGKIL